MPEKRNLILGHGEKLTKIIPPPLMKPSKAHPYTFSEAKERLAPRIIQMASDIATLPTQACPHDEAVAVLQLHPAYLAKSFHPSELLDALDLRAVGSRKATVKPEKQTGKKPPDTEITTELFVAGKRDTFSLFADGIEDFREEFNGAGDLSKVEDFRYPMPEERLRPLPSDVEEPLLEVVLHASRDREAAYIVEAFEAYAEMCEAQADMDHRLYAGGLCFVPVRAHRENVLQLAKFAFLRVARAMPRLRQLQPVTRAVNGPKAFCPTLPSTPPIDPSVRVAVFDGGVADGPTVEPWVRKKSVGSISEAFPDYEWHGTAVTSALLFGSLESSAAAAPTPYAYIDHYRVLDVDTSKDDQSELYTVLKRIQTVLTGQKYNFMNLSIGPAMPVEDDDVHAWTAVLDECLADGELLACIAVGNGGENDPSSGNARIQTPADCVNAIAIGAADSQGEPWKRASYSSMGPGRSPGFVKPDALSFGGCDASHYWVLDADNTGFAAPTVGTSFASPNALRTAIALRAHFGIQLSAQAIRAIMLHSCNQGKHDRAECGWGRIPSNLEDLVMSDDNSARVVYTGTLSPAKWLSLPIPLPAAPLNGMITIRATFCYSTSTDPQDPFNYTRSGLEVKFRPHIDKDFNPHSGRGKSKPFFRARDQFLTEAELRKDAHKWETVVQRTMRMRGTSLKDPVFEAHYNARSGGGKAKMPSDIPYALVVTVTGPEGSNLYNGILNRYRTILSPLVPTIQIPVRV